MATKLEDGTYLADRTYLKHYVRLRRFLVPKYAFYAALSTFFLAGWIYILFIPARIAGTTFLSGLHSNYSFIIILIYIYGLLINIILAGILWYETLNVLREEKI